MRGDKFNQLIEMADSQSICTKWDQLIKRIITIKNFISIIKSFEIKEK